MGVLGEIAILEPPAPALGAPKQRALLAMLALSPGRVVSIDSLVDGIWGEDLPAKPEASLHVYVHGLRRIFDEIGVARTTLARRSAGYVLDVAPGDTDLGHFEAEWARARAAIDSGDPMSALTILEPALQTWRGEALSDLRGFPFAETVVARFDEMHLAAKEDLLDLRLECGAHAAVVGEAEEFVARHPTRERVWGQLMVALYRCDRQADALAAYGRARALLADELGLDPGETLVQLELAVLQHDPDLAAPAVRPTTTRARSAESVAPERPSRRRSRTAGSLPHFATPTFGRVEDADHLRTLIDDPSNRLVTVTGPGGTGKTRLVSIALSDATDTDDVWFVAADDGSTAAHLLVELGRLWGAEEPTSTSLDAVVDHIAEAAPDDDRIVVVLDNLETVADAPEAVSALLSALPAIVVVVTSRVPLRLQGEMELALAPLASPHVDAALAEIQEHPAVQLFVDRARRVRRDFAVDTGNAAGTAEICRLLDGLPLAIELAAGLLRTLEPSQLVDLLRRRLDVLASTASDVPDRQRTLIGTIDWSLENLDAAVRNTLEDLALFDGGFALDVVEALAEWWGTAGAASADQLRHLGTLVELGLVRRVASRAELRHQVLGVVRARIDTVVVRDPTRTAKIRGAHASWLTSRLHQSSDAISGPQGDVVLARCLDEHAEVMSTLQWALSSDQIELAVALGAAAQRYWSASGRLREGQDVIDRIRRLLPPESDGIDILVADMRLSYDLGDVDRVIDTARTIEATGVVPPAELVPVIDCYRGAALIARNEIDEGRRRAEAALEGAVAGQDTEIEAIALSVLAIAAARTGDFEAERGFYERRLAVVRRRGDRARVADTLNTLAEIALDISDVGTAAAYAEEALQLAGPDRMIERRDALVTAARAATLAGDPDRAVDLLNEAVELAARTGHPFAVAQCARVAGCLAVAVGDPQAALRLFASAAALAPGPRDGGDPPEADLAATLAAARSALGDAAVRAESLAASIPISTRHLREMIEEVMVRVAEALIR